ncbi:MAG: hypothetical protein IKV03_03325 [Alphaproteobacteria bacterium]|jgi:hypothetical protein|nr:hypothetical protein [Alphaproteobacteria bacterium]
MYQEKKYQILPTTNGRLVFAISVKSSEPSLPKILYDGGEHAVLCRSENEIIVLDFLHPTAKEAMQSISEAYIAEIDYDNKRMVYFYPVHVDQVLKMPIDLSGIEQPK